MKEIKEYEMKYLERKFKLSDILKKFFLCDDDVFYYKIEILMNIGKRDWEKMY